MGTFEKAVRFFWACAPGIAIGLWLAPQLGLWWPIAALAGAVVSYLLVEWKAVVLAIPKAARKASPWFADRFLVWEVWKARGGAILAFLAVFSSSAIIYLGMVWMSSYLLSMPMENLVFISESAMINFPPVAKILLVVAHVLFVLVGLVSIVATAIYVISLRRPTTSQEEINLEEDMELTWYLVKFANPLAVFFYWPVKELRYAPRGIVWFFLHVVWEVIVFCVKFCQVMIILTHTRKRTLAATVTFMTIVLGYVVKGDIIVFTLAGAGIGALYSVSSLKDWVVIKVQPQPTPAR